MTKLLKIILPLTDEFNLTDLDKNKGFVDAYLSDIDRPFLDSHLFLMYEWGDKKNIDIFYRFQEMKKFYNYRIIYIDKKPMIVYCFVIIDLSIKCLLDCGGALNDKQRLRVLQFWQFTDSEINAEIIRGTMIIDYAKQDSVPLGDYLPTEEECLMEQIKGEVL